jgi:ketosteroid isomerase-like protein
MKAITATITCLFLCLASFAQKADEQAVRKLMDVQTSAWNAGNIDAFMETYWKNDSLLFVGGSGPTYGWQTTLNNYKKRYPDTVAMGKLHFDLLQLNPMPGNYYFVLGKWHLQRTIGDIGGFFTLLFRKINGKWVIIADHTS